MRAVAAVTQVAGVVGTPAIASAANGPLMALAMVLLWLLVVVPGASLLTVCAVEQARRVRVTRSRPGSGQAAWARPHA
jgi:hypothetical protein